MNSKFPPGLIREIATRHAREAERATECFNGHLHLVTITVRGMTADKIPFVNTFDLTADTMEEFKNFLNAYGASQSALKLEAMQALEMKLA